MGATSLGQLLGVERNPAHGYTTTDYADIALTDRNDRLRFRRSEVGARIGPA